MKKLNLPSINALTFPKGSRFEEEVLTRWNPALKVKEEGNNVVEIYQVIGEDFFGEGFTARRMSAALRSIGEDNDIVVSINSPGGDFFEGATIYNLLREHKGHVTVKIPGLAASAASLIAMAGDTIQISEVGFLMIHNSWGLVMGNKNDMRKAADVFDTFDAAAVDVYAARTGVKKDKISKMMDDDTWMNGSKAVEEGFADEILAAKAIEEVDNKKKAQALARRSLEAALAKQGITRKEREDLFAKAFGERDAAGDAMRDAGAEEDGLRELLNVIKA
jgi:ATP-dependent Clp protease protease subunit